MLASTDGPIISQAGKNLLSKRGASGCPARTITERKKGFDIAMFSPQRAQARVCSALFSAVWVAVNASLAPQVRQQTQ
jgi:hypothetical protein